jgi:tetratricopeptide (TPR) repeat protein
MFRYLGLHPGRDIGIGAIGALCQLDDQLTRRSVRELLSMNLLSESAGDRYNFHDLLRVYSRDLIKGTDTMNEQDEATHRLIDWYVASTDNADAVLSPGRSLRDDIRKRVEGRRFESYDDALSWMESERANLIDIVRRASEIGEHHSAAVIPNLMWTYFNVTKHWADWITCNEIGLVSARRSGDKRSEAYLQTSQGVAHGSLRHTDLAIEAHSRAIELFEEVGEVDGLGYAHNNLANAYNNAGRYEQAIHHYQKAIAVFADVSDPRRGQGMALNGLALCFIRMERYTDSLETARRAYAITKETGHIYGAAVALNNVGRAEAGLGRFDRAARTLRDALALRRRVGDRQGTARSLTVLGQVYADHGRRDDSLEAWSEALAIFTELGSPERADVALKLRG